MIVLNKKFTNNSSEKHNIIDGKTIDFTEKITDFYDQKQYSIKIFRFPHAKDLPLPSYATEHSAGIDLYASVEYNICIKPGEKALISTGIGLILPKNHESFDRYEAQIRPRSGLALKYGVTVLNAPGTIDADYNDEIKVILINHGAEDFFIERGMRVAQMVISRCVNVIFEEVLFEDYSNLVKNRGGFGSTGK